MANANGRPSSGPSEMSTGLGSPRMSQHPHPGQPGMPPPQMPPQIPPQTQPPMWQGHYFYPGMPVEQQPYMNYQAGWYGMPPPQQHPGMPPQHQKHPQPMQHHPAPPVPQQDSGIPMSPRNHPIPIHSGPATPTPSHAVPPPLSQHHSSSSNVSSPPPTPSARLIASAFVPGGTPRTKKIVLRSADGTQIKLENLKQQTQSPAEPPSALIAMSSPAAQRQRTHAVPTAHHVPPPLSQHHSSSSNVSSPPPTPSTTRLNTNASAFVAFAPSGTPRTKKIVLRSADGTQIKLENLKQQTQSPAEPPLALIAMSSPAAQHQRTEDAPTRSKIWHSDGSIVLQVDNTQFRVHWSLLALNSSFFRDMQGLPQPPNQPSIEGCPIVELHDAVVDVEYLLTALYTPTFLAQTALPLPAIAALIRLGRKYNIQNLLDSAVSRLTFENPTTLKEYDALLPEIGKYATTRVVQYPGIFFDIVSLARENDILSVLPAAYYRLVLNGLDELLDGVPRDDGTLASLAPVDLRRCIRGREKLIHIQLQPGYSYGWYRSWKPGNNCTLKHCTKTLEAQLRDYSDNPCLKALSRFTPNNHLNRLQWCPACRYRINELTTAGRQKTWDELPSFFDLPPWDELKNDL